MKEYSDTSDNFIAEWLNERYRKRIDKERNLQMTVGNREKKSLLYRLDRILDYSGLRNRVGNISAEIYIMFIAVIMLITGALTFVFTKNVFLAISVTFIVISISSVVLYVMSGIYYNRLEKGIMTFLNLVENFSKTENDIVQIFKKTIHYMDEPLKGILEEFCGEAESLGDTEPAFENMIIRLEHVKCRELFRNLSVCSKYEANYDEVACDCRTSMLDYLSVKAERAAIISNGRAEIIILIASAVCIVFLFSSITENLFEVLTGTLIGNIILFYCCIVFVICMIVMIMFDKRS